MAHLRAPCTAVPFARSEGSAQHVRVHLQLPGASASGRKPETRRCSRDSCLGLPPCKHCAQMRCSRHGSPVSGILPGCKQAPGKACTVLLQTGFWARSSQKLAAIPSVKSSYAEACPFQKDRGARLCQSHCHCEMPARHRGRHSELSANMNDDMREKPTLRFYWFQTRFVRGFSSRAVQTGSVLACEVPTVLHTCSG